jgi:TRAP transporter TAXI family solute receptor
MFIKKTMKVISVFAFSAILLPSIVSGAGMNLTVCGASPGGLWSLLGAGLDVTLKAAYPGSTVTYQTSSGGYANIKQVKAQKCELAIIHLGEGVIASKGLAPFTSPVNNFRVLSVLYDWAPMQWLITKEFAEKYGLRSLDDLAKKKPPVRLLLNRRGILPSQLGEAALKSLGVSIKDIESWGGKVEFQASKNAAKIMSNRRADMLSNSIFVNHRSIRAIAKAVPITLLNVPSSVISDISREYGQKPWTIKADAYPWLNRDINTFSSRAVLIADKDMSPKLAYQLTKAMLDHSDKMRGVHKAMKGFTTKLMASVNELPYHAGAMKAYKEKGLK